MKKHYCKPRISVESFAMDRPIAANCLANFDDVQSLIDLGYFGDNDRGITSCAVVYDEVEWGNDTVCYHSNVQTAFLS